jgi:phosphoribosylglycinamide formyltransferase-1
MPGEPESGVTVHYVNSKYDEGNIISQAKVKIEKNDTPESLSQKVQAVEKAQLLRVINDIASKK